MQEGCIFERYLQEMKVLIIGIVWPEPNSSAAGSRMMQLIELFKAQEWELSFVSPAVKTPHSVDLESLGIQTEVIKLNHDSFDEYLKSFAPDIVLFDRFMIEEQFGWRVAEHCPDALRILDTEDLHCLRKVRQEAFKKELKFQKESLLTSEIAKREIASIYRCDLTLIISTYEMELLSTVFKVDKALLWYLPFLLNSLKDDHFKNFPEFEERSHFMTIGNFKHEPNWNMVLYLKERIWPLIKKELPEAELHVYGSYPSGKVTQLHNEKQGFLVKGWAEDANQVMQKAKVCLAPLRFGAGIKGKFVEAMQNGTPSVTTTIGAEGMHLDLPWSGKIVDEVEEIVASAITLYTDKAAWEVSQNNGKTIINRIYKKELYSSDFINQLDKIYSDLKWHRRNNFIGSLLLHHTLQSTKYLSKWITEKEAKNNS